jgi:hypothetical protein
MALAGSGMALPVVARPSNRASAPDHAPAHSALVEVHPMLLTLAWASMSAALIHFAVIQQHLADYWVYGWFASVPHAALLRPSWSVARVRSCALREVGEASALAILRRSRVLAHRLGIHHGDDRRHWGYLGAMGVSGHLGQPRAEDGGQLGRLAEEQAALRRVATLVARGASPAAVFAAVAQEVAQVLHFRMPPSAALTTRAGR